MIVVILSGIELKDLIIESPFAFTGVESEVERSLGGNPVVFEQAKTGKAIDLVGEDSHGVLVRSTLEELIALASQPRGFFTLVHDYGAEERARFRNEDAWCHGL